MRTKSMLLLTLIAVFSVVFIINNAWAVKPLPNQAPEVTAFDVPATSPSPVPIAAFDAIDSDGTVTGYLITETSVQPAAADPGWSGTAPTEYNTSSVGSVTLYAWAKDDKDAVSETLVSDTVDIPQPPIDADTLDGIDSTGFALDGHSHFITDVNGLDAALAGKADISHNHDGLYQQKYANVAVVAVSGGDYSDPVAAMQNINAWCGTPSADNPCLLKLMPGVYDIGSNSISTPGYLDIEGSGENATVIRGNVSGTYFPAVLNMYENSEVRFLTVENIGGGARGSAIRDNGGYDATGKLTHVTARTSGKSEWNMGIILLGKPILNDVTAIAEGGSKAYGMHIGSTYTAGPLTLRNVDVIASGASSFNYAIYFQDSTELATLSNVTATATGGFSAMGITVAGNGISFIEIDNSIFIAKDASGGNQGAGLGGTSVVVRNSRIIGGLACGAETGSIHNSSIQGDIGISGTLNLALSEVDGIITNYGGTLRCLEVYDSTLSPVTCPP